jgi:hypothetical protein
LLFQEESWDVPTVKEEPKEEIIIEEPEALLEE